MRRYSWDEWAKVRERGPRVFVLRNGFLGRGLPMGIVTALAIEAYLGGKLPDAIWTAGFAGRLLLAIAIFTASGSVAAWSSWSLHERRFQEGPPAPRAPT